MQTPSANRSSSLAGRFLAGFDRAELEVLDPESRSRCESLLVRLEQLRHDEVRAARALSEAQFEVDQRAENGRYRLLHGEPDARAAGGGARALDGARRAVEQRAELQERNLVFVRGTIQDLVDEIGHRLTDAGRRRA